MSGALRVANLSAGYPGRPVIAGLTLPDIHPGDVVAFVGPNAAGKSTLLRALAGLTPASGEVLLGERPLLRMSLAERSSHVTYMPQALPQGVALSVLEGVVGALKATRFEGADLGDERAANLAIDVLSRIGIEHLALERLDRLSGGQRQLASLAQALARAPRVLLLDEPTSALDLHFQLRVLRLTRQLAKERGLIVVIVLHDLHAAAQTADRVVVLSKGAVAADGAPERAITPEVLASVYHVRARVDLAGPGDLRVIVDDVIE